MIYTEGRNLPMRDVRFLCEVSKDNKCCEADRHYLQSIHGKALIPQTAGVVRSCLRLNLALSISKP